jgi:ribose-phosphate pyrophosphokinase
VRGKDVYVVQPTGPPVNDNIMELLLMVSTSKSKCSSHYSGDPYYGYASSGSKCR